MTLVTSSRKRCSLSANASCAARRSVMSRVILTKPTSSPSAPRIASRTASAQKRVPSLRMRQPSSSKRPVSRAVASASAGLPAALSSGVKKREKCCPMISASAYPLVRSAPGFQLVTTPLGSSM